MHWKKRERTAGCSCGLSKKRRLKSTSMANPAKNQNTYMKRAFMFVYKRKINGEFWGAGSVNVYPHYNDERQRRIWTARTPNQSDWMNSFAQRWCNWRRPSIDHPSARHERVHLKHLVSGVCFAHFFLIRKQNVGERWSASNRWIRTLLFVKNGKNSEQRGFKHVNKANEELTCKEKRTLKNCRWPVVKSE